MFSQGFGHTVLPSVAAPLHNQCIGLVFYHCILANPPKFCFDASVSEDMGTRVDPLCLGFCVMIPFFAFLGIQKSNLQRNPFIKEPRTIKGMQEP